MDARRPEDTIPAAVVDTSALGGTFSVTPMIVPACGHLDSIRHERRLCIGRGLRQRLLEEPLLQETQGCRVRLGTGCHAVRSIPKPTATPRKFSRRRLVCPCQERQPCRADADVLVLEVRSSYPQAYASSSFRGPSFLGSPSRGARERRACGRRRCSRQRRRVQR